MFIRSVCFLNSYNYSSVYITSLSKDDIIMPGRTSPRRTPATLDYAPIVVAMAASFFGNQFDVTFAGALYMNGCASPIKVCPIMQKIKL